MKYKLDYKCERCGKVIKRDSLREIIDNDIAFRAMVWGDLSKRTMWNPSEVPPDRIMCECATGCIGIARFVGWSMDSVSGPNVSDQATARGGRC